MRGLFNIAKGQCSLMFTSGRNNTYDPENVIALIIKMIKFYEEQNWRLPVALLNILGVRWPGESVTRPD